MFIRPVCADDAVPLAHIQTTSWRMAFAGILAPDDLVRLTDLDKVTAMYVRLLASGKGHGYIGEVDGQAHCIVWWDKARDVDMSDYAEIICIHSLPGNWRKGYGRSMMEHVLADMQMAGFTRVMLWVFTANTRARAFYEALGFVPTDQVKPALGTSEIRYTRKL